MTDAIAPTSPLAGGNAPPRLYDVISRWRVTPFAWGDADCCLLVADWVWAVTGYDPAAPFRGLYDSAATANQATGWAADPLRVVGPRMAHFPVTDAPRRGDVGILRIALAVPPRPPRYAAAIRCDDRFWALKTEDGAFLGPAPFGVLRAWSIGYAD